MYPISSTSNLMNEEALARLEAGLRAQREKLRNTPLQSSPGVSPADNGGTSSARFCQEAPECGPIDLPDFLKRDVEKASA
jgi:hypothetical protein